MNTIQHTFSEETDQIDTIPNAAPATLIAGTSPEHTVIRQSIAPVRKRIPAYDLPSKTPKII